MKVDPKQLRDLRVLMDTCERLFRALDAHGLEFWLDWGTLLGHLRQGNVIPWDYDGDICMMKADYDRLIALAAHGLDGLALDASYYGEPNGCCFVSIGDPKTAEFGVDIVAYAIHEGRVESLMSKELIARYPGNYDFDRAALFPLRYSPFVGRLVGVPQDSAGRVRELYGPRWMEFPDGHLGSPLTEPPCVVVSSDASEGEPRLVAAGEGELAAPSSGTVVWWLVADEDAQRAGLSAKELREMLFTELVFAAGRALWGRVHVAVVHPSCSVAVPAGWSAWRSPEHAVEWA